MHHLITGAFLLCEEDLPQEVITAWFLKNHKASFYEREAMEAHHLKNHTVELVLAAAAWACKGVKASRCDDRAMQCIIELLEIKKQI